MACGICPGYFAVWFNPTGTTWELIENVDSWSIDANVQEATKKRTSSTNNLAQAFCEDIVSYTASVTVTLCPSNWLFCDILAGNGQELGNTYSGWFFFGWANAAGTTTPFVPTGDPTASGFTQYLSGASATPPSHTNPGVYLHGKVVPPGFGGDNTSTDPTTATFTINIGKGPILPICSGEDFAP